MWLTPVALSAASRLLGQQLLLDHRMQTDQASAFAPVRHRCQPGGRAAGLLRKGCTQLDPAIAGLLQHRGKAQAVGLHLAIQCRLGGVIAAEGALQLAVPVVAMQRPVQHHQAARQTSIADRALKAEGFTGLREWRWQSFGGCRVHRQGVAGQLTDHHPGG